jgi:myo-inositol-1(or 4)-monophosphatase
MDQEHDAIPPLAQRRRWLALAEQAARQAALVVREGFGRPRNEGVHFKGEIDLVTDTDRRAEVVIRTVLDSVDALPILGEEEGGTTEGETLWVVDPIDGTTNFVHRLPHFAVSIGVWHRGAPLLGVVLDVMRNEMFRTDGDQAWLNDRPLEPLQPVRLADALVVSGFAYDRRTNPDNNLDLWETFVLRARGARRLGAASLDLSWVAAGRLDAYWEAQLKPWDFCAGAAVARVAGARVSTWGGNPLPLQTATVLCAHPELHEEMLGLIHTHRRFPLVD